MKNLRPPIQAILSQWPGRYHNPTLWKRREEDLDLASVAKLVLDGMRRPTSTADTVRILISEAEFEDALALLDNVQAWAGQGGDREERRRSLLRARNSSLLQRRIKEIFDLGQSDPEADISEMAVDLPPTD